MRFFWFLFFVFCFFQITFSKEIFFKNSYTLWKDGDILIWDIGNDLNIDPKEFCLSLKRNNSSIGEPKCRILGEWERDSISLLYGKWLKNNLDPFSKPEYLKARHPAMNAKIQSLEDKIVLFVAHKKDSIQVALFNETENTPKIGGIVPFLNDKIALYDLIAENFFDKRCERRLTQEERKKRASEPDDYYKEVPHFEGILGLSIGYSQAKIPLTPNNWYNSHIDSKVKRYRITKDSTSLWNFIDDSTPFLSLYGGGIWYGFIGAEIFYRLARHDVKTDKKDTSYNELDYWYFYQHEIGLNIQLSRTYTINSWLDITPFFFLGFQYSFFVEKIDTKKEIKTPSKAYDKRVEFEDIYKGAIVGIGSRIVMKKHYGLSLRGGISSRGRDIYSDPSPDAAAEPTTIGGSTIDCFISLGLEYHWIL